MGGQFSRRDKAKAARNVENEIELKRKADNV